MTKSDLISRADAIKALRIEYEAVLNCEEDPTIWNYKECAIDRLYALPSAENSNAKTQNSNQETQKSNGDLIYRADAIEAVRKLIEEPRQYYTQYNNGIEHSVKALSALPSAEAVEAVKDCRNCRHGGHNEHWETWFCYNNLECSNWGLWEPAEAVQGWIPCSERLPEIKEHHVSDPCLVYCENGVYGFAELEENIFGQVGWNCEREDEYHEPIGEVLAWMPLPKPYKGGGDE